MIQEYSKDIYSDKKILKNQLELINLFKKNNLPVIVAVPGKGISKTDGKNPIMLHLWGDELKGDDKRKSGQKHADLILELQKIFFDKIIKKPEYSAFYDTDLEKYCKTKKINELYICGIYSGVYVHYTGIDAAYRRIWPILVTDASTTYKTKLHKENCIRFSETVGKIISTKELIAKI